MKRLILITIALGSILLCRGQQSENEQSRQTDVQNKKQVGGKDIYTKLERSYLRTKVEPKVDSENNNTSSVKDTSNKIEGRVNNKVKTSKTNTYIVEYNFKEGVYERNNFPIRINAPVAFKVTNINRLAYKIDITNRDSVLANSWIDQELTTKEKEAINKIADATAQAASNKNTGIANSSINDGDTKPAAIKEVQKTSTSGKDSIIKGKTFIDIIEMIGNQTNLQTQITNNENQKKTIEAEIDRISKLILIPNDSSTRDQLLKSSKELDTSLVNLNQKIKSLTDKFDLQGKIIGQYNDVLGLFNTSQNQVTELYRKYHLMYIDLLEIREYYNTVRLASENPFFTYDMFDDFRKTYDTDRILNKLAVLQKDLRDFDKLKYEFDLAYISLQNVRGLDKYLHDGGIMKLYASSAKQREIVDIIYAECAKAGFSKVIHSIKQTLNALGEKDNYEVTSAPVQPLYDMVEFDIKTSLKNEYDKPHNSRDFRYRGYVSGGVRMDAGLGVAMSYLNNTPKYALLNDKIVVDEKNQFIPSLVAMFTATRRSAKQVAVGASIGIGVGMHEDSGIELNNFYLGGTAMFGKSHRFALSAGLAIHRVDKLKSGYVVNETPITDPAIAYTTKTYSAGPFLAITYNLTKGLKDSVKYVKSFM